MKERNATPSCEIWEEFKEKVPFEPGSDRWARYECAELWGEHFRRREELRQKHGEDSGSPPI